MKQEAKKYNNQEGILGIAQTNYVVLNTLNQNFTNYQNVWRIVNYWRNKESIWMNDDLNNISYQEIDTFADKDFKTLLHSIK